MLKYFDCEAGRIPIEDCLNKCPRPEGRCLSLPTLKTIGSAREWKGTPSVTQLISPTRMEYLKLTKDYAENPKEQAFRLLGTRHHATLEDTAKLLGLDATIAAIKVYCYYYIHEIVGLDDKDILKMQGVIK